MQSDHSQETAFRHLMQECFRINRELVAAVAQLTRGSGITGAQWGVLGAVGGPTAPLTVAQAAVRLGLTRQSVQRVADLLEEKELIEYAHNPKHRRAKLANVTDAGRTLLDRLQDRQSRWVKNVAGDSNVEQVEAAAKMVKSIRQRLLEGLEDRQQALSGLSSLP